MKGVVLMHHLVPASGRIELLSIDLWDLSLLCVDHWRSLIKHHGLLTCLDILLGGYKPWKLGNERTWDGIQLPHHECCLVVRLLRVVPLPLTGGLYLSYSRLV